MPITWRWRTCERRDWVEPDSTYEFAATPRATGGIRQLFTVPENIRVAQYGREIYRQFETLMAVDGEPARIDFHRMGYLWLGFRRAGIDALMANWRVQTAHDARVELLDRKGVTHRFPSMRIEDLDIAAGLSSPIRRGAGVQSGR